MPAEFEFKKNLPNILAIGVLIVALVVVATQAGLLRCSDLGDSYCDIYYTIMGKPSVLMLTGDAGLGDPTAVARYIQDTRGVPVRTATVDQLSAGMLKRYNVVIVERAREIPTEKLKIIKDYVFNDFGRLVWVGDAGTQQAGDDKLCKTMKYTAQWDAEDGRHKDSYEYAVCVKESELTYPEGASVTEMMQAKQQALFNGALARIKEVCGDAFQGKMETLRWEDGFQCVNPTYANTYIMWTNEDTFRSVVNPWTRGDYDKPGLEESVPGINFGEDVLGVSFIADEFAVSEFNDYQQDIKDIKTQLALAHAALVECTNSMPESCDPAKKLVRVQQDLADIVKAQGSAETELSADITTLKSLETQKKNANATYIHVTDTANRMQSHLDTIKAVNIPDNAPTTTEVAAMKAIKAELDAASSEITTAKASETDATVKSQFDGMVSKLTSLAASAEVKVNALETDTAAYRSCETEKKGTLADLLANDVGFKPQLETLMAYASPLLDDNAAVEFINVVNSDASYAQLASKLGAYNASALCGTGPDVDKGLKAAGQAITLAETAKTQPALASEALATLMIADTEHELVKGVSKSIDLKKGGLPVPFVLVETSERKTYTVTQLKVTPAYKGQATWPAITVKDPKFAVHAFGRGTVVYYAFPPETDEVFMDNLVDYILY